MRMGSGCRRVEGHGQDGEQRDQIPAGQQQDKAGTACIHVGSAGRAVTTTTAVSTLVTSTTATTTMTTVTTTMTTVTTTTPCRAQVR
ncbi:hypothetical protein DUI87_33424 [Hirundo rustica rustica]|uniref:Uncharacterized protein n=1 Tax=Hirundo rustica rustica TaxID=333673 RepID=A0A3M0ILB9_HIRRU|nr:hypothetical protein DUI87_33424 [Hirundo rustica rustica]